MILSVETSPEFVAINAIRCRPEYAPRFRELFQSRAHAIDRIAGFVDMMVLEPQEAGGDFLVVSRWTTEAAFQGWTQSPEFAEGHRRAFEDLKEAKELGAEPPMHSKFATYSVLAK